MSRDPAVAIFGSSATTPALPPVAVGEEWQALRDLLTVRLGAHADDAHTVSTTTGTIDWLLDQPEIRSISRNPV